MRPSLFGGTGPRSRLNAAARDDSPLPARGVRRHRERLPSIPSGGSVLWDSVSARGWLLFPNPMPARVPGRRLVQSVAMAAFLFLASRSTAWPCKCGPTPGYYPPHSPLVFIGEVKTVENIGVDPKTGWDKYSRLAWTLSSRSMEFRRAPGGF